MGVKLVTALFQLIIGWFSGSAISGYSSTFAEIEWAFPYLAAFWIALTVWIVGLVFSKFSEGRGGPRPAHILSSFIGAVIGAVLAGIPGVVEILPPEFALADLLPLFGAVLGYHLISDR
jgi:hypothetical protein